MLQNGTGNYIKMQVYPLKSAPRFKSRKFIWLISILKEKEDWFIYYVEESHQAWLYKDLVQSGAELRQGSFTQADQKVLQKDV